MAIFYNHIKGIKINETVTPNTSTLTYFYFQPGNGNYPTITVGTNNLGQILTNLGGNQTIEADKIFYFGSQSYYITNYSGTQFQLVASNTHLYMNDSSIDLTGNTTISGTLSVSDSVVLEGSQLNIYGNIDISTGHHINIPVGTGGYITAPYFVATSDKHYKENFKPLPSVLDFITSTSLYTFNYKSSPEDRNIGIIAQDVENYSLDDFNLVLNIKGEKGEFKAVKESKIPYILWKGIQEESGKISRLEEENAALAKKVDKLEKVVEQLIKLTGLEAINEIIE